MRPGSIYAYVDGFGSPAFPFLDFVLVLPYDLPVELTNYEVDDDLWVTLSTARVPSTSPLETAHLTFARGLVANLEHAIDFARIAADIAADNTPATVLVLQTRNEVDQPTGNLSEDVYRLFLRALAAYNGVVRELLVATEDHRIWTVTPEALGHSVVLLTRNRSRRAETTGLLTLPRLLPTSGPAVPEDLVAKRIETGKRFRGEHPVDDMVLWRVRAEYLANVVGDYEMSVVALATSAERLIHATWSCLQLDGASPTLQAARGAHTLAQGYRGTFQRVCLSFGEAWTREPTDGATAAYWRDLYALRNLVVHEGHRVDRDALGRAHAAHAALYDWISDRSADHRRAYPLTATLLHSWVGLVDRGQFDEEDLAFQHHLAESGRAFDFWKAPAVQVAADDV